VIYVLAGYFALMLVSTVLLIRLRPEWVLTRTIQSKAKEGWEEYLSPAEQKELARTREYSILYVATQRVFREVAHYRAAKGPPETWRWEFHAHRGYGAVVVCAFSPLVLLLALPVSIAIRAATASVNKQESVRVSLERDLAAARKEIDELLRGGS
jgi:hypothetical protein